MKVLLPIDGSLCSNKLIQWAASTLNPETTEFYLVTIIPQGAPELVVEQYQVEEAVKMLKEAASKVEELGGKVAKTEYVEGDPVESICKYATDITADQVMISSHGRTGLAKLLLGSVSTGVLENCPVPVIVYKNMG